MDFEPAEQVAQALALQERAYVLLVEAQEKMKVADRLIKQLTDEHGSEFICGGEPFVVSQQGSNGKWPYNRPRLDDHKGMPVIDEKETEPSVVTNPPLPSELANELKRKLEEANDSDKPIQFEKEVDESQSQSIPRIGDSCY